MSSNSHWSSAKSTLPQKGKKDFEIDKKIENGFQRNYIVNDEGIVFSFRSPQYRKNKNNFHLQVKKS